MASYPAQERQQEFLNTLRKSQETASNAIKTWAETIQSVTSDVYSRPLRYYGLAEPETAAARTHDFAEELLASKRQIAAELAKAEDIVAGVMPAGEPVRRPWVGGEAQVYTMRDLNQHTAEVMKEIEEHKAPAFITKHGRFVAMITPLEPGQIESRVLADMAREINKGPSQ